ncbi:hypothetical protein VP01_1960g10 [Puccinia sorghi]|uniref:Uncharacterized protein n=1 Tax=Puccinia sorghi TaxID=27349 RepID=A0A0L6VC24_9BASI|nr:hypothetical protein VP01_1960g10 [Puccinia sorghi]
MRKMDYNSADLGSGDDFTAKNKLRSGKSTSLDCMNLHESCDCCIPCVFGYVVCVLPSKVTSGQSELCSLFLPSDFLISNTTAVDPFRSYPHTLQQAYRRGEQENKRKKKFKSFLNCLRNTLENFWNHIQHQVSKYCGYYAQLIGIDSPLMLIKLPNIIDRLWKQNCCSRMTPANTPISIIAGGIKGNHKLKERHKTFQHELTKKCEKKKKKKDELNIGNLIKGQKELLEISFRRASPLMPLELAWSFQRILQVWITKLPKGVEFLAF